MADPPGPPTRHHHQSGSVGANQAVYGPGTSAVLLLSSTATGGLVIYNNGTSWTARAITVLNKTTTSGLTFIDKDVAGAGLYRFIAKTGQTNGEIYTFNPTSGSGAISPGKTAMTGAFAYIHNGLHGVAYDPVTGLIGGITVVSASVPSLGTNMLFNTGMKVGSGTLGSPVELGRVSFTGALGGDGGAPGGVAWGNGAFFTSAANSLTNLFACDVTAFKVADISPASATNNVGDTVAFSVVSGGSGLSEYSGATTATLTIYPVGTNDAGIYTCTVMGVNGSGWGSVPGFLTVPVPPAPTGVTAVAGNDLVTLSWAASAGATSYKVYCWTSGAGTNLVATVTTTGYTNVNLPDDVTYYYEVTAVNANGEGADSSEVSATPYFWTTIDPANHYAYGANVGWLDWRGNTNNGAVIGTSVCSGYIYGANVGWINLGSGVPTNGVAYQNLSASDFGVNRDGLGNLYGYAWGANIGWINFETNGAPKVDPGTGIFSGYAYSANCGWISLSNAFAYVQTGAVQPSGPPAPTLLAPLVADRQVSLSWTASTGATSYKVYRSTSSGAETYLITSSTTNCTDSGLVNGTTYYYEVTAVNSGGQESATKSNEVNATPVLPSAPQLFGAAFAPGGGLGFSFISAPGVKFTVYASTDVALPLNQWTPLGPPVEDNQGSYSLYQFTDPQAASQSMAQRFYLVSSP